MATVVRVKPNEFVHVIDNNTNVTRVVVGPSSFTVGQHEAITEGPTPCILVPPRHFVVVANPVIRDAETQQPLLDERGVYRLRLGDEEVRFASQFPLYPGESVVGKVQALQVVPADAALRLRCIRDFDERVAGDEWLFFGPASYMPRVEEQVVEVIRATIVSDDTALQLRARKDCVDDGVHRLAGEEWIYRRKGAFIPGVDVTIVKPVPAIVLTDKKALHLRALHSFTDVFKVQRKAGDEWLVTLAEAETHIPDVQEEVVRNVDIVTLTSRQYCVVVNPRDPKSGKNQLGRRELRRGECSFFLQPGEKLEKGIESVYVLSDDQALLLAALCTMKDENGVDRTAGQRWMVRGPCEFTPAITVEVIEVRRVIPLDENEGIYVRDLVTGHVRAVIGESYLLSSNEELFMKELPPSVEALLSKVSRDGGGAATGAAASTRLDKSRVVSYRVPFNAACQIFDYKSKKSRTVLGPDLIMLGPDEMFTVVSLSGGTPKAANAISSLCLFLGPDFMTDLVVVETSDHARLSLQLAYNWHFEARDSRLFQVADFVGDSCKAIASRIRGAVAATRFEVFHKESADLIRTAVFGAGKSELKFEENGLVITAVDIQSVEPVDQRTRDSLQKSVQLAIEITTSSQEAAASHEARRLEQKAKGELERLQLMDQREAEAARKELLQLLAFSAAVESTGVATAESKAAAEAALIEATAAVRQAQLAAEAALIRAEAELEQTKLVQAQELAHKKRLYELEIERQAQLMRIEAEKFEKTVASIGAKTIAAMANAGPETQAKLLQGLGIKSFLITDGKSPVNLFSTAKGLVASAPDGSTLLSGAKALPGAGASPSSGDSELF